MIPENTDPISTYVGNDIAYQFLFYFRALKAADIVVTAQAGVAPAVTLVQGVDYSFTFKSFPLLGGTVDLIGAGQSWMTGAAFKLNANLTISYKVAPSQISRLREGGPLFPLEVEKAIDKLAMDMIGLSEQVGDASPLPGPFPDLAGNANKIVTVNATVDGFSYGPVVQDVLDARDEAQTAAAEALVSENAAAVSASDAEASKLAADADLAAMVILQGTVVAIEANCAQKAVDADISADAALVSENNAAAQVVLATVQKDLAEDAAFEAVTYVKHTYYTTIVDLTFADSPYDILVGDDGKLFRVDTSGGNVIINMPTRPSVSPDWRASVVKTDASANTITIFPFGADTIGGLASQVMSLQYYGFTMHPGIFSDWLLNIFIVGTSNAGLPTLVTETPTGVIDGVNTSFLISQSSITESLIFWLDGVKLSQGQYSVLNQTVTLTDPPVIGQSVEVWYFATDAATSGVKGADEYLAGVVNGVNLVFTVSDYVFNKASTVLFKNGVKIPADVWSLTQSSTGSTITFSAGNAPVIGSVLEAFYLVNILQAAGVNDASNLPYIPTTPADWSAIPTQVAEALDELADVVKNRFVRDSHTGDGVTLVFALSFAPTSIAQAQVFVDGILKEYTVDYSIAGSSLTFVVAPTGGQKITSIYIKI